MKMAKPSREKVLTVREVRTTELQQQFLDRYLSCMGRPRESQAQWRRMAPSVFSRSQTMAYFENGSMRGGYCIVHEPPLPAFQYIPEEVSRRHPLLQNLDERQMVAISMLWLDADLRNSRHAVRVWLDLLSDAAAFKRQCLIYSYHANEKKNSRMYRRGGNSVNVYEGLLSNGSMGGVDIVPMKNLAPAIEFLRKYQRRNSFS
jgi:hypothetical protein